MAWILMPCEHKFNLCFQARFDSMASLICRTLSPSESADHFGFGSINGVVFVGGFSRLVNFVTAELCFLIAREFILWYVNKAKTRVAERCYLLTLRRQMTSLRDSWYMVVLVPWVETQG